MTSPDEPASEALAEADRALPAAYEQQPIDPELLMASTRLAARTVPAW